MALASLSASPVEAQAPPQSAAPPSAPPPAVEPPRRSLPPLDPIRPPPLHVDWAQYGVAIAALFNMSSGATCGTSVKAPPGSRNPNATAPCILGSGGGLVIRGGYRAAGPWYIGGAYEFTKMDSSNLFRLGIFQQLRAEMRYQPDTGYRAAPYVTWGLGGVAYGNEWGVETGGAMVFGGGGFEFDVTRNAVLGLGIVYRPTLIAGWTDTASIARPLGLAHFFAMELRLEQRTELGRR